MTNPSIKTQYNPEPIIRAVDFVKENILPFDDAKDGRRFLAEFENFLRQHPDFKNNYPDLYQEISETIVKLKWLCLPNLAEKAIIDLIANNFTVIFTIPNFNLTDKFKTALTHLLDLAKRDELKAKVKTAILKNSQVITKAGVIIDTHEHRGTVANWLIDYNKNLGGNRPADTLKFREYITRGQNTADLEESDKAKLLVLFSFYELLKLSSQTPQGLEESIAFIDKEGHLKVLEDGMMEDVDANKQVKELMKLADVNQPVGANLRVRPSIRTDDKPVGANLRVRPSIRTDDKPVGANLRVRPIHPIRQTPIGQTHRSASTDVDMDTNMDNFTFQDAQIVDQFRQPGTAFQPHQFADKLQQIKNIIKPGFAEPWFEKRLDSLILTYLKGIRDEIDTRQRLADNVKIGGLGLGPEIINQIFEILSSRQLQPAKGQSKISESLIPDVRPAARAPQTLSAQINSQVNKLHQNKELPSRTQDKLLPKLSARPRLNQIRPAEQAAIAQKQPQVKRIDFNQIDQNRAAFARFQPKISSKPIIQDVKAPPGLHQDPKPLKVQLIGPIQEIARLNLADLRKAGNVANFTDFLLNKIKEIEKTSYVKKSQAVKAWQISPLYRLYLKLGSASLQQDKSLQDVIKVLDPNSNLTWEEFVGISRLNGEMRY